MGSQALQRISGHGTLSILSFDFQPLCLYSAERGESSSSDTVKS